MLNNDELIKRVKSSSNVTAEKDWELPLWNEYCNQIR